MTLEQLNRFVEALNKFHEREELLSDCFGPFNSSWTMIEFCPEISRSIFEFIKEEFEDVGDWFGYWFYELDQGKNKEIGASTMDEVPIKLDTLEDLYNFMMENKATR